ncbi:cupin domain-containing protein [Streptomyces luteireticuli]|uniref:Cupin type-2 domain-containing protein n=1 Tax=Streptomyces luteireticuli TaxID=173858 RepID=A0ABP3I8R6_9ACTN
MNPVDLRGTAAELPDAWNSRLLGRIGDIGGAGGVGLKVLRMDGRALEPESHGTAEALLVLDGTLRLTAGGVAVEVCAGEMYVVGAGVEHAVRPGSRGTLVIVERLADPE